MPEFTLVGLRVLAEVAARGSFTAAASALDYTQSAVSRQVALMEAAAGAPLFERLPRGVRPTPAGAALVRHAAAVLDRVAAAELELRTRAAGVEGRLVLGAFPTALAALVPRALARLAEDHPGVAVRLREGGSPAQLRRLRARRVDVAVVAAGGGLDYDLDGLRADRLLEGGPLVVVAAGHRLAGRGWVSPGELQEEAWIVGEPGADGPQFGPWPTLTGSPRIAHAVRDWPARLGLVAAGLGVATVPGALAGALPPGVRALRVDDPQPVRREILAVTHPGRDATVDAVVAALRAEGADQPRS